MPRRFRGLLASLALVVVGCAHVATPPRVVESAWKTSFDAGAQTYQAGLSDPQRAGEYFAESIRHFEVFLRTAPGSGGASSYVTTARAYLANAHWAVGDQHFTTARDDPTLSLERRSRLLDSAHEEMTASRSYGALPNQPHTEQGIAKLSNQLRGFAEANSSLQGLRLRFDRDHTACVTDQSLIVETLREYSNTRENLVTYLEVPGIRDETRRMLGELDGQMERIRELRSEPGPTPPKPPEGNGHVLPEEKPPKINHVIVESVHRNGTGCAGTTLAPFRHDGTTGTLIVVTNVDPRGETGGATILRGGDFPREAARAYCLKVESMGDLEILVPPGYRVESASLSYRGGWRFTADRTLYRRYSREWVPAGTFIPNVVIRRTERSEDDYGFYFKLYPR